MAHRLRNGGKARPGRELAILGHNTLAQGNPSPTKGPSMSWLWIVLPSNRFERGGQTFRIIYFLSFRGKNQIKESTLNCFPNKSNQVKSKSNQIKIKSNQNPIKTKSKWNQNENKIKSNQNKIKSKSNQIEIKSKSNQIKSKSKSLSMRQNIQLAGQLGRDWLTISWQMRAMAFKSFTMASWHSTNDSFSFSFSFVGSKCMYSSTLERRQAQITKTGYEALDHRQ